MLDEDLEGIAHGLTEI